MNSCKKPPKFLLHFLAYFLLVVLLPFDHCHAATDRAEKGPCPGACHDADHDAARYDSPSVAYEKECHAHHRHHLRFLIDSEDAVLKSSPAGDSVAAFLPCALMAITGSTPLPDRAAMQMVPGFSARPLRYYLFTFSGLSPPRI